MLNDYLLEKRKRKEKPFYHLTNNYESPCMCQAPSVTKQEEFIHLVHAAPNTEHQELQWRKVSYFITNRATRRMEANAPKPELPDGIVGYRLYTRHHG